MRVGLWLLGLSGVSVVVTGLLVLNALTLNSDARALRGALLEGLDARSTTRVQLSVGPVILGAARVILGFVDRVPEEARLALSSAQSASVGVYTLKKSSSESNSGQVVAAADLAMTDRGWTRVVAVTNRNETVLIYTPTAVSADADGLLRVCVGVCHGRELVVVSAKVSPAPLVELASKRRGAAHF